MSQPERVENVESVDLCEDLWEMILKYKQSLTAEDYPPVAEREADRQHLWSRYEELQTLQHKLLDTRAYLQLGRVQGAVNKTLLSDNMAPFERLGMLSRVVRMLTTPVIFLPGSSTVSLAGWSDHGARDLVHEVDQRVMADEPPVPRVRARPLEDHERVQVRPRLLEQLGQGLARETLADQLGFDEAELLSQLASRKDTRLLLRDGQLRLERCDPEQESDLERIAVVIKEKQ